MISDVRITVLISCISLKHTSFAEVSCLAVVESSSQEIRRRFSNFVLSFTAESANTSL